MKPLQQCFHKSFSIVRKYNQEFLLNLRWVAFFGVKAEFPVHISKVLKTSEKKIGRFFQRLFRWWQIRLFIKPLKKALNSGEPLLWLTTQVHTTYSVSFKQKTFCSHASALLRQLPKSFFHIVWVEVEIQKAPELNALPQCSFCDHLLVYLQHPAIGKRLRGTCKVLGTAHQSPAAGAKKHNWSVQIFKQDGASKH